MSDIHLVANPRQLQAAVRRGLPFATAVCGETATTDELTLDPMRITCLACEIVVQRHAAAAEVEDEDEEPHPDEVQEGPDDEDALIDDLLSDLDDAPPRPASKPASTPGPTPTGEPTQAPSSPDFDIKAMTRMLLDPGWKEPVDLKSYFEHGLTHLSDADKAWLRNVYGPVSLFGVDPLFFRFLAVIWDLDQKIRNLTPTEAAEEATDPAEDADEEAGVEEEDAEAESASEEEDDAKDEESEELDA